MLQALSGPSETPFPTQCRNILPNFAHQKTWRYYLAPNKKDDTGENSPVNQAENFGPRYLASGMGDVRAGRTKQSEAALKTCWKYGCRKKIYEPSLSVTVFCRTQ